MEQEHDQEIDSFVQQLMNDGYFDEEWDDDDEDQEDEEDEDNEEEEEEEEEETQEQGIESGNNKINEGIATKIVNVIDVSTYNNDNTKYCKEKKKNKCIDNKSHEQNNVSSTYSTTTTNIKQKSNSFHDNKRLPLHSMHCISANNVYSMQISKQRLYFQAINVVN